MYLEKKQVLKRLKAISKMESGIPYDAFSDEFKRSIDGIEKAISKNIEPCDWWMKNEPDYEAQQQCNIADVCKNEVAF